MSSYATRDRELNRSLNFVIYAITFGNVFFSIFGTPVGSPLYTGFMRKLGADDLVYAVVMALPVLGGAAQIFASYYMEKTGSRRGLFLVSGLVHRLLWIPVAILPLVLPPSLHRVGLVIITALIVGSSVGNSVATVGYNSWMGDLVPFDIAGRFFARRTLVSTVSGALAGIGVGILVDHVNNFVGFAIAFLVGAVFGTADILTYFFIRHPPFHRSETTLTPLAVFVLPFRERRYRKLVVFATLFYFAVNFAVPFFNVYMLENLHMNYFMITVSNQIMSSLFTVLTVSKWGTICDRFGYKPVVWLSGIGTAISPILWFFVTPGNIWLVFLANIVAGISWAGFNLAIFNQSVWLAPEKNRSAYIASYSMMTTVIGGALAFVAGGYFMQYFGPVVNSFHSLFLLGTELNAYEVLFLVSGLLRLAVVLVFEPMVCEEHAKSVPELIGGLWGSFLERFGVVGAVAQPARRPRRLLRVKSR